MMKNFFTLNVYIFYFKGYFRVNYDLRNWQMINQQLKTNHVAISVINRAQILDDALNLAEAGMLDYDIALNLTQYLEQEDEYLPWDATLSSLSYMASMMSRSSGYGLFKVRKPESHYFNVNHYINMSTNWISPSVETHKEDYYAAV